MTINIKTRLSISDGPHTWEEDREGSWSSTPSGGLRKIEVSTTGSILTVSESDASLPAEQLTQYRIWCPVCNDYFNIGASSIPSICINCDSDSTVNVTSSGYYGRAEGSETFELGITSNRRWIRYKRKINFSQKFKTVPTVTISDVSYDGFANLRVVHVTKRNFVVQIIAVGRSRSKGLTSVDFNWAADEN